MTPEEAWTETRADYFAIDCTDPMFDVPDYVYDTETADWHAENESEDVRS